MRTRLPCRFRRNGRQIREPRVRPSSRRALVRLLSTTSRRTFAAFSTAARRRCSSPSWGSLRLLRLQSASIRSKSCSFASRSDWCCCFARAEPRTQAFPHAPFRPARRTRWRHVVEMLICATGLVMIQYAGAGADVHHAALCGAARVIILRERIRSPTSLRCKQDFSVQ